jgi:prefoldin subunit 5
MKFLFSFKAISLRNLRSIVIAEVAIISVFVLGLIPFALKSPVGIIGIVALAVLLVMYGLILRLRYMQRRNEKLTLELLLNGTFEADSRKMRTRAINLKNDAQDLLRRASNYRESQERVRVILEISEMLRELNEMIESLNTHLDTLKARRLEIAKYKDNQRALETQLDYLRRQASYIYNFRRSIEELIMTNRDAHKAVNDLAADA